MDWRDLWRREFPVALRVSLLVFLPAASAIVIATALAARSGRRIHVLFRDPAALMDASPLLGFFSNLGAFAWCTAAAVTLFAAALSWRLEPRNGWWRFFLAFGLFSLALLADDFFEAHEYVEEYLRVPQWVFYLGYALALCALLAGFARRIADTHFTILLLGAGFLALSAGVDLVSEHLDPHDHVRWRIAAEDGAKFLGILGWCAYHVQTAFEQLLRLGRRASVQPAA